LLFTYLTRELRRRYRQTLVISIGFALGIGLVITVTAASAGVSQAQSQVLHALYGVGTDITVSKTATAGTGGPSRFGFQAPNAGQAGQAFSRNVLTTGGQGTLDASTADSIAKLDHVAAVSSSLQLTDLNIQGHFSSTGAAGGGRGGFGGGGGGAGSSGVAASPPPVSVNTTSIDGVSVDASTLGPITSTELTSGRFFTPAQGTADDAIVTTSYARQQSLSLGSTVAVASTPMKVVGLVNAPAGSDVEVYIPLGVAQSLAGMSGEVTQIYVQAAGAGDISTVQSEIDKTVSGATVTTSSQLANEITGSLSTASTIITKLGLWLAVAVLIAAFGIAILLTMSAVTRRVREFGTLKALGWPVRRVVAQVMSESLVQGVLGGVLGIALGFVGAALVTHFAPPLDATPATPAAATTPRAGFGGRGFGGRGFGGGGAGRGGASLLASHTIPIHLTAQVQTEALILAVCLAIAGGLLAGAFGGWRAASLRPAEALRRVE
jgi:ABC-type antimicrobial peptide transport system permease subunit